MESLEILDNEKKNQKCCKHCRHFCAYIYEYAGSADPIVSSFGECRRFPPKMVPEEENGFPVVENDLWCGEFDI